MSPLLIHERSSRNIFKELFLKGHDLQKPVLPLNRVVHWKAHMDMIGCDDSLIGNMPTLFFGGYIYNHTTPQIDADEIEKEMAYGKENGAKVFFVPTVREIYDCSDLRSFGFKKLPCFVESAFELEGELDDVLKERVGKKRFSEILRLHHKASKEYDLKYFTGLDIQNDDSLIGLAAELHDENIKKYSYPTNFYNRDVIAALIHSELSKNLVIGIRYSRNDRLPVQVMIMLVSEKKSELYGLVQGIHHESIPKGHNLYIAGIYDTYFYAEEHAIKNIMLGRGGHEEKAKLGANKFYLLNHWIFSEKEGIEDEIARLSHKTLEILKPDSSNIPIITGK